jgi:SAM-dependent methyltransferase
VTSDRLFTDPDLAQFYDLDTGWGADCDYCCRLAEDARSVLDLGCGTGLLAAALAADRFVVGVDPAAAMLDIARRRVGGDRVPWVEADARDVRLQRQFDLVLLAGHAFQVFLSRGDQAAVLRTIASHLAPRGRFVARRLARRNLYRGIAGNHPGGPSTLVREWCATRQG